ncbi:hypothetical protein HNY73_007761 [Argiope bruennichi]|uniref:MADF domain-containing protein n=1 Tax=Argiope bruennichi TaxID=94029 RepID=A0A8T0FHH2_ARGBR|nr:hypothetical protein HNY73_007761 [Argiope bruennichi]
MKLSDSETCKFVSLYREHECLWNVDSAAYKNKNLKRKALETMTEAISSEIGLQDWTPELVKAKLKSLRGTYNIESKKIRASKRSGIGAAELYVPNLRWFHMMDEFMNVEPQPTFEEADAERNGVEIISTSTPASTPHLPSMSTPQFERGRTSFGKSKKRNRDLLQITGDIKQLADRLNVDSDDEVDAFGRSIALHIKKLKPESAIQAQLEIQGIISKYRLHDMAAECAKAPIHASNDVLAAAMQCTIFNDE